MSMGLFRVVWLYPRAAKEMLKAGLDTIVSGVATSPGKVAVGVAVACKAKTGCSGKSANWLAETWVTTNLPPRRINNRGQTIVHITRPKRFGDANLVLSIRVIHGLGISDQINVTIFIHFGQMHGTVCLSHQVIAAGTVVIINSNAHNTFEIYLGSIRGRL